MKLISTPPPLKILKGLVFLFLFFTQFAIYAQENPLACGSKPMEDAYLRDPFYSNSEALLDILRKNGFDMPKDYLNNLDTYGNYIGRKKNSYKSASTTIREIPIQAWIWRNDNGTGNISQNKVYETVNELNDLFSETNIRFYLLCEINEVDNSNYTNNADVYFGNITTSYKTPNVINAHFVIDSNDDWGGKANFPFNFLSFNRFTCALVSRRGYMDSEIMGGVLAHEIGHTLGLYHTHHPGRASNHSNNGGCGDCHQESVSRTRRQELGCVSTYDELKCDVNGDFLCDTAADPELSSALVNYQSCNYASTYTDNWGEIWTPNVNNIMSYSYYTCRDYFSPLQIGRMNYYYTQIGINQSFYTIYGPQYLCAGQSASFYVNSIPGVSSYTWETSNNFTIISGQGTNSIQVQASNNNGGNITVIPSCGNKSKRKYIRKFNTLEIDGFDTACAQSGFSYTYSVPSLYTATYTWSITNGSILYGQGTDTVEITLAANSNNQSTLSLQIDNVCTNTIYKYKQITHGDPPPPSPQCFALPQNGKNKTIGNNGIMQLYPNPANTAVTIVPPNNETYNLAVFNVFGQNVYKENKPINNKHIVATENLSTGIYFVSLIGQEKTYTKKLIIKK